MQGQERSGFSLPWVQLAQPWATLSTPTKQVVRLAPGVMGPGDPNQCQRKESAATPESSCSLEDAEGLGFALDLKG